MEKEPQSSPPLPAQTTGLPATSPRRRAVQLAGLALFSLIVVVGGYFLLRQTATNGNAQDIDDNDNKPPQFLFPKWTTPDLAIIITGQMHGYLQPCGCSVPQFGGLARRWNFLQTLKNKGWPLLAIDLGEIAQTSGPQATLKYQTAMKALNLMQYKGIGLGKNEFLMPLTDALAHFSVDQPMPRPVALNLANTDEGQLFHDLNVRKWEVVKTPAFKVGLTGAIGHTIAKEIVAGLPREEKDIKFIENDKAIPKALAQLGNQKIDIGILLYQGYETQQASDEVKTCAKFIHDERLKNPALAPIHLVACLTREEEPPSVFLQFPGAPKTHGVAIGHKGRYVGVVGLWKTAKGVEMKYQIVSIGPEYDVKDGQVKQNSVLALMEEYAQEVAKKDYLAKFPRNSHPNEFLFKNLNQAAEPRYVGSEKCANCHVHAFNVWTASGHSHAYDTLVKAEHPKLRQFDGECIACHTVGFQYKTGYYDPPKGANQKKVDQHNAKLRHVGCESCHGPCSEHFNQPNNTAFYPIINPFSAASNPGKAQQWRMQKIDDFCQKCHDLENDVNWGQVKFQHKWVNGGIIHMTPRNGNKAAQAKP